jgi:predicted ATP-dependent Lon-type protease
VLSDSRAFDAVQRRHPVFVKTAFLGEVGNHRRQKRIEIVCVWLRKGNDAEAIADHLHVVELHNTGPTTAMTLAAFVALCSGALAKPIQQQMVILGGMSLGGNIVPVENLAESLQVAFDAGAKRILLPMASVKDIPTIPGELFAKFQTGFYADASDAVFKALGVS